MPSHESQLGIHGRTRDTDALTRLARMMKILTMVSSKRAGESVGRTDLADACGCDVRTVQRDIDMLNEGGAWIDYDRRSRSYALQDPGWHFPIAEWTPEDTIALALARVLLGTPDVPQGDAIKRAFDKATGSLSPALRQLMADAAAVVHIARGPRDYGSAPVSELAGAAARRETVEIDYESRSSDRSWRRVDPYQIERGDGQLLYLHGWCHKNQAVRAFALDRIHGVRGTSEIFDVNKADWDQYAATTGIVGGLRGGASITVEARFLPEVAAYAVAHTWPEGLTITAQPGGSALLTGTVHGTDGIVAELLRWKRDAVVLGGAELRAAMVEEIAAMAEAYRQNG
jgi:predicted DNA-binding transcriptional regulator YafY